MAHGQPKSVVPQVFAGHNVDYLLDTRATKGKTFMERIREILSSAWENRSEILGTIGQVASIAAPFLLAESPAEQVVVRACYIKRLIGLHSAVAYF